MMFFFFHFFQLHFLGIYSLMDFGGEIKKNTRNGKQSVRQTLTFVNSGVRRGMYILLPLLKAFRRKRNDDGRLNMTEKPTVVLLACLLFCFLCFFL